MVFKPAPLDKETIYLFNKGCNYQSYRLLGAHLLEQKGVKGVRFVVWAPNARSVRVVGDFNAWDGERHAMSKVAGAGLWSLFVPGLEAGVQYKYDVEKADGWRWLKSDPYAFWSEMRPGTASVVYELGNYAWNDSEWLAAKKESSPYEKPMLIYEVHLGSWRRTPEGEPLNCRDIGDLLPAYAAEMGYTHIELLPVVEHPFDGSWGYQATGYYSFTSRYGRPEDFMYLVDKCHQHGLGVILDWVPGHFCKDDHGLRLFDGTHCYEPECSVKGENQGWGTSNFDYGRTQVQSFLISNAIFWQEIYHIDGFRVDAVSNILYLDYGREDGEWLPNRYGGNGNLEGIAFLRHLNAIIFQYDPKALMMAEESTSWPMVSWPTDTGGLGFNFKWNMGWMNDMLRYMETDPIHRKWYHQLVTFSFMYAFSENYILALSHDEVVHGKRSLLNKMPGDYWQKFANLRAFYGYWLAHPGKKLLFMGGEIGQFIEWDDKSSLDWHLLEHEMHQRLQTYCRDLNHFYRGQSALWQKDFDWSGFYWIDCSDYQQSIIVFARRSPKTGETLLVVCNFTPEVRYDYRIGVPELGSYEEVFNSDRKEYGGAGETNEGLQAEKLKWQNQPYSLRLKLPPLATLYLRVQKQTGQEMKEMQ